MPSQNQDRIKQEKEETIKHQRSKKSLVNNEISIKDALKEVETFLMKEMETKNQERDSDQSILYLTKDQLISNEKRNLISLSNDDVVKLKSIVREIVSEELDKRGFIKNV